MLCGRQREKNEAMTPSCRAHKRLTIGAGGVVTLLSACDGYDPLIIRPGDDFTVMGRAVAAERELA
jgi:hypothetical protein